MWWPSPGWYEGHLTAGTTETATNWVLADGRSGAMNDTRTYVLLANPRDTLAHVTFDLVGAYDYTARVPVVCHKTVDVAPHSRYTADIRAMCQLDQLLHAGPNWIIPLAGTVTSDGPGIIVERSTYSTTGGQFWSQGSSTALSKVPQP
jgi:hypothetical protein